MKYNKKEVIVTVSVIALLVMATVGFFVFKAYLDKKVDQSIDSTIREALTKTEDEFETESRNTLAEKQYEISCGNVIISFSQDKAEKYYLSILMQIEERWKAAFAYTVIDSAVNENLKEFNPTVALMCGDVMIADGILLNSEKYDYSESEKWLADGTLMKDFNEEEAGAIVEEILDCIVDFIEAETNTGR